MSEENKSGGNKSIKKSNWIEEARFRMANRKWLMYSSEIARRILAKIEGSEDITQAELARKLDISRQQVSKIVKGQENLTLETIAKISAALGTELISFPEYEYSYAENKKAEIIWTQVDTLFPNELFQTMEFTMPEFLAWKDIKDNIFNTPLENAVESVEPKKEDPSRKYLKAA